MHRKEILVAEDDKLYQEFISIFINTHFQNYSIVLADDGEQALDYLKNDTKKRLSLALLDLGLPKISGKEVLKQIKNKNPNIPVIIHTADKDIEHAIALMQAGATDYITKPASKDRLLVAIQNALKIAAIEKENTLLRNRVSGTFSFKDIIGVDGGLSTVIEKARKAATSDIPILLQGETGVGKEIFARAIHGESARADKPFIVVNCGAIPEHLIESILFGHEKDAFSGATKEAIGKFREADGGTIFLNEVGDLPPDVQIKLLHVLQTSEVISVGSNDSVPVDVRIISSTHRDLAEEVQKEHFKEALFYKINVLPITLPPLRNRKEDIEELAYHFIEIFSAERGVEFKSLSKDALNSLMSCDWPGNIQQLKNMIHRAIVMCDDNEIHENDLFEEGENPQVGSLSQDGQDTVWHILFSNERH
jgi:DNA-binding NtrC family response regulator